MMMVMFVTTMLFLTMFVVVLMGEATNQKVGGKPHQPASLLQRGGHQVRPEQDDVF
jgi:hypothetical protein